MAWHRLRRRYKGFGTAGAGFGAPLSLRDWRASAPDPGVEALGAELMSRIAHAVPVLPVPLTAAAILQGPVSRADLPARAEALALRMAEAGATLKLPPEGAAAAVAEALPGLIARGIVAETPEGLIPAAGAEALLAFQAAPVRQWDDMAGGAATQQT
ncbi:MAG TPA: glycerol-3-phosphate acyltransferase, partial [Paracoccaceae bacterium]|nr:glycerol-3-phosphate acyltransferase [Paracoccaceae bacterium]